MTNTWAQGGPTKLVPEELASSIEFDAILLAGVLGDDPAAVLAQMVELLGEHQVWARFPARDRLARFPRKPTKGASFVCGGTMLFAELAWLDLEGCPSVNSTVVIAARTP